MHQGFLAKLVDESLRQSMWIMNDPEGAGFIQRVLRFRGRHPPPIQCVTWVSASTEANSNALRIR